MVLNLILQFAVLLFLLFVTIVLSYFVYDGIRWIVVSRYRRSRANDISSFLNSEFRKLYYYEFRRACRNSWQIGVLQNGDYDDDSWDFCNYFEDVYKNLIDEYKRLTNNEDRL